MNYLRLFELIEEHPAFGPRLRAALEQRLELVLDYHCHEGAERWCLSVQARAADGRLHELAHIQDFGLAREDCVPLLGPLSLELLAHYDLDRAPEVHLEGAPFRGL